MNNRISLKEAVSMVKDGDCIGINSFSCVLNPRNLMVALGERYREERKPNDIEIFSAGGFGDWSKDSPIEEIMRLGGVRMITSSFFGSCADVEQMVLNNEIEAYNLPLGTMSHMIRAASSKKDFYITNVGKNIYMDSAFGSGQLNERSKFCWAEDIEIDGKTYLKYKTPKIDIAFIKGSSVDEYGNISFEDEGFAEDAFALALSARVNGGKVLVQVAKERSVQLKPREVIIPAALVDGICICPDQTQIALEPGVNSFYSGEEFVAPDVITEMIINSENADSLAKQLICTRAAREIKDGYFANLGIGTPEGIAKVLAQEGRLDKIMLAVESGVIGGMPVGGTAFGYTIGGMCTIDMAQMFDVFDGGGLDITFVGALEIDREGNVNVHHTPGKIAGIGGFANLTQNTKKVVFCSSFSAGGLKIEADGEKINIVQEGKYLKFVDKVSALSFSAKNAHETGQEVMYITERCVFRLGDEGLELIEVREGIDLQKDILSYITFPVKVVV